MNKITTAMLLAGLLPLAGQAATLIHAGTVITAEGEQILQKQTLVIENDQIKAIEAGYRQPAATDTLIDLSKQTVLPGLMDMHTHFSYQSSPGAYSEGFTMN